GLPIQAQYVGNFVWQDSPLLTSDGAEAAPTIPAVTPIIPLTDTSIKIGTFSAENTGRTAFFTLGSGTLRVVWQYTGPEDSKFRIALGHESTQEYMALVETFGSGSGLTDLLVLFKGRDYFLVVESLGQWSLDVTFRPTQ